MTVQQRKAASAILLATLLVAFAGCGANDESANQVQGDPAVDNATLAKLSLTSKAFRDGQPIPTQYTCDGAGLPPALAWGAPPHGTNSFALVVDDPDAPGGTFHHWAAYDIPASARALEPGSFAEAVNDFGKSGYGGPCPPPGHGPHHYRFTLFALDIDRLDLGAGPKAADVEMEAAKHAVGRGELIGTYERR